MPDKQVRPNSRRLTDADARHLLADGLIRTCHVHGPARVALETGCDEKTIRRAREEETTLKLACALNLLDVDRHALDTLLAAKGFMIVPTDAAAPDIVSTAGAAIHRIGEARDPEGDGGRRETDAELIAMEEQADGVLASALALRARIVAAKLRRAA